MDGYQLLEQDDDNARSKIPLLIRYLPRSMQKLIWRYCTQPVLLVLAIIFFLIILPLCLKDTIEEAAAGINGIYTIDDRYKMFIDRKPGNRLVELSFTYRREILTEFYPYLRKPDTNCIDRKKYGFEFTRLLGIDPYHQVLKNPWILLIGNKTDIGSAIYQKLNKSGQLIAQIGCQNNIDFASSELERVLDHVNITHVIFTCPLKTSRYAKVDGYKRLSTVHSKYLGGLIKSIEKRKIPLTLAVSGPLDDNHASIVKNYGGNIINAPILLSDSNIVARTIKECNLVQRSTVEIYDDEKISNLTPEIVAEYVINNFKKKNIHVNLVGDLEERLSDIINSAVKSKCDLTISEPPHSRPMLNANREQVELKGIKFEEFLKRDFKLPDKNKPYCSILVVGRHDNFSGNFMSRTHNFLQSIGQGLERIPLANVELVYVDYATPPDFEPLHKVLKLPKSLQGRTRFIQVPVSTHVALQKKLNSTMAFFEYIVKNIGIRRSKGDFILSTNPDNIFPSTLFEVIAEEDFNEVVLYRAIRWDTRDKTLDDGTTIDDLIQGLGDISTLNNYDVKRRCTTGEYRFVINDELEHFAKQAYPCGTGDFIMLSSNLWEAANGFPESPTNMHVDAVFLAKMMKMIPGYARFFLYQPHMHQKHPKMNIKRPSISNHDLVMEEYACSGESKTLGKYCNSYKWGLQDQVFEEVLV